MSVLLNGDYDVVCVLSILWLPVSRLGRLHLHVFKETETPTVNHIFAYWVLTYGLDRIIAGAYTSPATDAITVLSHLMESSTCYNEASLKSAGDCVDGGNSSFVQESESLLSEAHLLSFKSWSSARVTGAVKIGRRGESHWHRSSWGNDNGGNRSSGGTLCRASLIRLDSAQIFIFIWHPHKCVVSSCLIKQQCTDSFREIFID